jgi:hypothetical protein
MHPANHPYDDSPAQDTKDSLTPLRTVTTDHTSVSLKTVRACESVKRLMLYPVAW